MKFLDEARIRVVAGGGGDGCIAFLREKYRPRGGPAGGDGGTGGSVIAEASTGLNTLQPFRHSRLIRAERGENGRGKNQHGRAGDDAVVAMPVGTLVFDAPDGTLLADLTSPGQRTVLAAGGRGGRGNARFATSTHQAPRRAETGEPGEERDLHLELRLLADAGLVGLPNAGKSSLLARVSAARPKIADYPFTTVEPMLGVVSIGEDGFVLADIPGLISGAHEGRGLGLTFLRHVSRTRVLVHVVDAAGRTEEQAMSDFDAVNAELAAYSSKLASRPQLVAISKVDLPEVAASATSLRRRFADRNIDLHSVSSATGEGCGRLMAAVYAQLGR